MKSFKLLACLVTLQFMSGLTFLEAAPPQAFRKWADSSGRVITARLLDVPDANSIKIEREDGRVFTVAVTGFSKEDQAYVARQRAEMGASAKGDKGAAASPWSELDAPTWENLSHAGSMQGSTYINTPFKEVLELLNRRLAAAGTKTTGGTVLEIRTEPVDMASRLQLKGELSIMNFASFIKEIARVNNLAVKMDKGGQIVLLDKTAPLEFLGVTVPR